MTPATLAKSGTEHGHQAALFAYCAVAYLHGFDVADEWCKTGVIPQATPYSMYETPTVPALEWFHAIHNQGHGDKVREVFAAKIAFARTACGYRCGLSAKFADRKAYFVFYSVGCLVYFVRHVLSFPMIERSPDYTTAGALWLVFRRGPAFAFGHYTRYGLFWRFAFAQFDADCFDLDAAPKGGQQQGQQGVGQFAPVVQQ